MENRLVYHMVVDTDSDFYRGVDAMLISKSGSPIWKPSSLKDVPEDVIKGMFEKNPHEEELQFSIIDGVPKL
jgi:hypothetical protein